MRPATFVIKQIAETVGTLLQQRAARKFVLKQPTNLSTLLPCIVTFIALALISEKGILIAAPASDVSHAFRERRSVYIRDIKPVGERARCGQAEDESGDGGGGRGGRGGEGRRMHAHRILYNKSRDGHTALILLLVCHFGRISFMSLELNGCRGRCSS